MLGDTLSGVFLRKVKTASGATAVQIARRENRRDVVIEHLPGSTTPPPIQSSPCDDKPPTDLVSHHGSCERSRPASAGSRQLCRAGSPQIHPAQASPRRQTPEVRRPPTLSAGYQCLLNLRKPPNTLPLFGNGLKFLQARQSLFSWFAKCERLHGYETLEISVPSLPPYLMIKKSKLFTLAI